MNELKFEVIQQPGVINVDGFTESKDQLAAKMEEYKTRTFTEDTKKEAKAELAFLRKFKKAVNDRKIEVRNVFMTPYVEFEGKVKELIALVDEPIFYIDGQVKEFEEKRVNERKAEIRKLYDELVSEDLKDYIPLECIYGTKWDNASTTIKSVRQEIQDIVSKTEQDISVISAMRSEQVQKALYLYMENRDLARAVKYINDYEASRAEILAKQAEENEKKKERERQAEIDRVRREERERIQAEEKIRETERAEVLEELKSVDEKEAAPLVQKESMKVLYTVVATKEELQEIEMALTSLGVYFERKDV